MHEESVAAREPGEPGAEAPGATGGPPRTTNLAVVAGAVILIGLVAFAFHRMRATSGPEEPAQPGSPSGAPGSTPAPGTPITAKIPYHLTPEASIVAENYRCVCGCPDRLSVCTCDKPKGSNEMKAYLQGLVNEKKTRAEIDAAMAAKYGPAVLLGTEPTQGSPSSAGAASRP